MRHVGQDVGELHFPSPFSRVVVGIDETEQSLEACRQAARLVDEDGTLEIVSAVDLGEAVLVGPGAPRVADEIEAEARSTLQRAAEIAGDRAESRLLRGSPVPCLHGELQRSQATLVALGTHGHSRISEILLGGVAGPMLHSAPCSVLLARPPRGDHRFPESLVAGIDGSAEAEAALAVAQLVAARFGASLRVMTALGGKEVDLERAKAAAPLLESSPGRPVDVLADAAVDADLLVVGNRGLHGFEALGSVSERVAHRGHSSVLVVRAAREA